MKIFVDFDGVLNTLPTGNAKSKLNRVTGFDDFELVEFDHLGTTFPIWLSEQRNALVREIAAQTDFVWLTTWGPLGLIEYPQKWIGVEGRLPATEHFDDSITDYGVVSWKEKTISEETSDGEPYVWVDDEAITPRFRSLNKQSKQGKLITPLGRYGLTRAHLEDIGEFVNG